MTRKEEINQAAVEAFKQIVDSDKNNFLEIFKAGAQWQKHQMMKQAQPAEVNYWNQRGLSLRLEDVEVEDLAEEGDKVKIIIIKED